MNPPHGDSPVCEAYEPSGSSKTGGGTPDSVGHANCEKRHALPYLNNPTLIGVDTNGMDAHQTVAGDMADRVGVAFQPG